MQHKVVAQFDRSCGDAPHYLGSETRPRREEVAALKNDGEGLRSPVDQHAGKGVGLVLEFACGTKDPLLGLLADPGNPGLSVQNIADGALGNTCALGDVADRRALCIRCWGRLHNRQYNTDLPSCRTVSAKSAESVLLSGAGRAARKLPHIRIPLGREPEISTLMGKLPMQ